MSLHEFLRCTGNLFHFLVCCKCIVCPKKSELIQNHTNVQVQQNVPIQRPPYTVSSDYEDGSIYNGSSMYGVPPVITQPKKVTHINPSGVTITAKSMTVANNEQFMHAVQVDFTCEVKGMVEVGGVAKEVKGMISIINTDNKSQVVSAVNSSLNQQTEEDYLEPIDASKSVKSIKRIGPLSQTSVRGTDEGYGSEKYGTCSSKDSNFTVDLSENIYDTIKEEEKEKPQDDIPLARYNNANDSNSSNSKTAIKNKLEKILSRQILDASSIEKEDKTVHLSSEFDDGVRSPLKSINEYYKSDDTPEQNYDKFDKDHNETGNISPCSSWASDEFDAEPIYGNNDTIVSNDFENKKIREYSTSINMSKEEKTGSVSHKVYNMVKQIDYNPTNSESTKHIPIKRTDSVDEYNDENIYEDIVINASVNQRY